MSGGVPEIHKTSLPALRLPVSGEMADYTEHTNLRIDQLKSNVGAPWRVYTLTLISGIGGFLFGYLPRIDSILLKLIIIKKYIIIFK